MKGLIFTGLLLLSLCIFADAQTTFRAVTDARQVVENGVFTIKFELRNARGSNVNFPEFENFSVVSGPSQEQSIQIINGRRSSSVSYGFTLLAERKGTYQIGKASIVVDGKTLYTDPITIQVVEGKPGATVDGTVLPTEEELFIRAEIDTGVIYPGQQVQLNYRLYAAVNISNYSILKESRYDDFYYRYVKDFDEVVFTKVIDGVQYQVRTLRSVALFPKKSGTFEIEPFVCNIGIGVRSRRRSFFFNTRTVPKTVATEPITIEVSENPPGAPPGFSGAVGSYRLTVSASPRKLSTDEALIVNATFTGTGDPKKWAVPDLAYLQGRFEVYEPTIRADRSIDENGTLVNRREVEYLLIPKVPGYQQFSIEFEYLNPDSADYLTARSQAISIQVTQGTGVRGIDTDISLEAMGQKLRPLQSPGKLVRGTPLFIMRPLFFFLFILPFIIVGYVHWDERIKDEYADLDPAERKRLEARRRALETLSKARDVMEAGDKIYYDAISSALFTYISGKLGISASEITKVNVDNKMKELGITEDLRSRVSEMIMRCEMVLYAGGSGQSQRQQVYDDTLELISSIERQLGTS